jgi:hypothetical protein
MVHSEAATLAESNDDFVLEDGFFIQIVHLQVFATEYIVPDNSLETTRTT